MVSDAVIGMSFDTVTHDFQLTFTTAAMAYAKREKEENHTAPLFSLKEKFGDLDAGDEFMTRKNDINQDMKIRSHPMRFSNLYLPFEPYTKGERETLGENEGYCYSPIYTGLTGRVAYSQHINYANRSNEYSLYEYAGIVKVVLKPLSEAKSEAKFLFFLYDKFLNF